ncbi:MAG: enoyl-CoA hydratase [Spirochaetaceae bacterium]
MDEYSCLLLDIKDRIAKITLNRPEKRNALSEELMRELLSCLNSISHNRRVAVVILNAAGKVFSSGHDLNEMVGKNSSYYQSLFDLSTRLMERIQSIPQPVIAEVQGIAAAAGCQLATSCDLSVASENARFSTPGVKIGLFCSTPMVALTRTIPAKKAMEMLLTGEQIDAQEALHYGLVNKVVSPDTLEKETRALAVKICETGPGIVALGKEAFYRQFQMPQSQAYGYAKEVMSLNATLPDAKEGIAAFLEKRKPRWSGVDSGVDPEKNRPAD